MFKKDMLDKDDDVPDDDVKAIDESNRLRSAGLRFGKIATRWRIDEVKKDIKRPITKALLKNLSRLVRPPNVSIMEHLKNLGIQVNSTSVEKFLSDERDKFIDFISKTYKIAPTFEKFDNLYQEMAFRKADELEQQRQSGAGPSKTSTESPGAGPSQVSSTSLAEAGMNTAFVPVSNQGIQTVVDEAIRDDMNKLITGTKDLPFAKPIEVNGSAKTYSIDANGTMVINEPIENKVLDTTEKIYDVQLETPAGQRLENEVKTVNNAIKTQILKNDLPNITNNSKIALATDKDQEKRFMVPVDSATYTKILYTDSQKKYLAYIESLKGMNRYL